MNGKKVLSLTEPLITKIVEDLGYELVDLDYRKEHYGMVLEVIIYKNGGVNINDCEKVSRALDNPLDELDPTNGASYSLNVSSPGIDRPLKKTSDFKRNLNNEIIIKFFAPYEGKKQICGVLISYTDKTFTIKTETDEKTIEISKTAKIEPVIKF